MMENIAIIIPVYNTSKILLSRCIDSCLFQTFSSFEIVIIDDGSTNLETLNTLKQYEGVNPTKIKLFTISNCGASLARKFGVENCDSDFIFFLDADDFIEKNALELLIGLQKEGNSDVVVGQFNLVSGNSSQAANKFELLWGQQNTIRSFLMSKLPITLWPNLFKRELFENVTFYDFPIAEDLVINSQIFTNENLKVSVLDKIVYNYYRHDDSLTKLISQEKTNQGYLATLKSLEIIEKKIDTSNLQLEVCINKLNTLYASLILNFIKCDEMLDTIKLTNPKILKAAVKSFSLSKRILFSILIKLPFTLDSIKFGIKMLKYFKSN